MCPLDRMGKVALKRFRERVKVKEIQGVHKWLEQGLGSTVFGEDAGRTGRPLGEERTMVFVALEGLGCGKSDRPSDGCNQGRKCCGRRIAVAKATKSIRELGNKGRVTPDMGRGSEGLQECSCGLLDSRGERG